MSMNELFGGGGSKPKLITAYTSGTGTYIPTVDMARCLVRIQAGGGGGGATGNIGGGGGAFLEFVVRVPIAGLPYVVGAGGSVATAGGTTSFGKTSASPGLSGATGGGDGIGGFLGLSYGSASASAVTTTVSNTLTGVAGGGGGNVAQAGSRAGFPVRSANTGWSAIPASNFVAASSSGISGGGDSFYGIGGTNGNSPAADNYGAGGGFNAAGRGGYIEIWDFGE